MDPGVWGYESVGLLEKHAAIVVSSHDAKRWKGCLNALGCLDKTRRVVTHPADEATGRPAAVAFPITGSSLGALRDNILGNPDPGVLAVCRGHLPSKATPVDQKAAARATGDGRKRAVESAQLERLPPALPLDHNAPPLWPPTIPKTHKREVERVRCPLTADDFSKIIAKNQPVVLFDVPMGDALTKWTPERFQMCAEANNLMDVHVCPPNPNEDDRVNNSTTPTVDLAGHRAPNTKRNFSFRKMPLSEFVKRVTGHLVNDDNNTLPPVIATGEMYYLRSVAAPKKQAAHFHELFPSLYKDLLSKKKECALFGKKSLYPPEKYHSSVLRVSSKNTALWTHYDTHDNLLAQVVGKKTVTLWAPDCEPWMHCEGSSSRVSDVDEAVDLDPKLSDRKSARDSSFPNFKHVSKQRMVACLSPGEALFIPALWFHYAHAVDVNENDTKISEDENENEWGGASVAVNVFWRSLPENEHDPGDIFGNKDPPVARQAAELCAKAGAVLASLPEPQRRFYARRAVKKLAEQLGMRLEL